MSSITQKQIDTLIHLGLTQNQARIYLANLHTGSATVKAIAQHAQIGREDVYRVLPSLQDLGLVKKCLGSPSIFEPVEPHEVLSLLITVKSDEMAKLRKEALEFVAHWIRGGGIRVTLMKALKGIDIDINVTYNTHYY